MRQPEPKALSRQRVILEVLAQRMTVTQAAAELGISRKTYYQWQEQALAAMRAALTDRPGGRPPNPVDPHQTQLEQRVEELERERTVLAGRLRIQEAIRETLGRLWPEAPAKKKRPM